MEHWWNIFKLFHQFGWLCIQEDSLESKRIHCPTIVKIHREQYIIRYCAHSSAFSRIYLYWIPLPKNEKKDNLVSCKVNNRDILLLFRQKWLSLYPQHIIILIWTKTSIASKWCLQKRREPTNGWLSNLVVRQPRFLNGVPMCASHLWKHISKFRSYSMWS